MTLRRSKGRQACGARILSELKPLIVYLARLSTPPTIARLASPFRIRRAPYMMALALEEHAVLMVLTMPPMPYRRCKYMATEAQSYEDVNGEPSDALFASWYNSSVRHMPPTVLAVIKAVSPADNSSGVHALCATASLKA